MAESTKVVSQSEALHKYQNIKHNGDGTCTVTVRYRSDGSEDPSCWNMKYRNEMEKQVTSQKKEQKKSSSKKISKPKKKGYWGWWKSKLGGWVWLASPVLFVIWIPILALKLVWAIVKFVLKIVGIAFLLRLCGVNI